MREILFRGKRKDTTKWVEGYFGVFKGVPQIFVPFTEEQEKQLEGHIFSSIGGLWYEVIPETVGQYTGLTDKNGKKIFEGDIIKYSIYPPTKFEYGIVNWYYGGFRAGIDCCNLCVCSSDGVAEYQLEVVGNIHDNPELLKGEPNENT